MFSYLDASEYSRVRTMERQIERLQRELDTLAECVCVSSDRTLQTWAFSRAKSRPELSARVDRILAQHSGHATERFEELPEWVLRGQDKTNGCEAVT